MHETVELVMEAYGKHFDEDSEEWAITGMLHDADYEAYPEEHPQSNSGYAEKKRRRENRPCHIRSLYQMECEL